MHILNSGGGHFGQYHQAHGVHQEVALTTTDPFATIKASLFTAFSTFGRLTVNNHGTRLRCLACLFSHRFADVCVELFPQTRLAKETKVVVNRLPSWKVVRQSTPDTAILDNIEHRIQDGAPAMFAGSTCRTRLWQVWRNLCPFGIIQVGRVGSL